MALEVNVPSLEVTQNRVVESNGTTLQIERAGGQVGPSLFACTCGSDQDVKALSSPVFLMQLRGYSR
jgi:hypothetical protein